MGASLTVFSKSCPHSLDVFTTRSPHFGRRHGPVGWYWKHLPALFSALDTEDDDILIPSLLMLDDGPTGIHSSALAAHCNNRVSDVPVDVPVPMPPLLLSSPMSVLCTRTVRYSADDDSEDDDSVDDASCGAPSHGYEDS
jgi:hypothetical protein